MSLRQQSLDLSLQVLPHGKLPPDAPIIGTLKIKGDLRIGRDLNAGDRLVVVVQDADGEVLATSELAVEDPPAFKTQGRRPVDRDRAGAHPRRSRMPRTSRRPQLVRRGAGAFGGTWASLRWPSGEERDFAPPCGPLKARAWALLHGYWPRRSV